MDQIRPVTLVVIDGLGCRNDEAWNAVASADTPTLDKLFEIDGWTTVEASGPAVGLPEGQMGNSEVGHLNIGAGRVVDQDVVRISKALESGDLAGSEVFRREVVEKIREGARLHLVGLLSDGGVHSLQSHLHGLIRAISGQVSMSRGEPRIFVHAILDGRDTPPRSAIENLRRLQNLATEIEGVRLATMVGRYYTMDRDQRWDRVRKGYDLITLGMGAECTDPVGCIERSYEAGISDEFIPPIVVADASGDRTNAPIDGDVVLFFNFRADRMRQIVSALSDEEFAGFSRIAQPDVSIVTMNQYHEDFEFPVLFPPLEVRNHLGDVYAERSLNQLRIAETEKYAHVTFFFNGGSDTKLRGEERTLVPSPGVETYDLQPQMSVVELTDRVVDSIGSRAYELIVLNIANPDMVGHTGVMDATSEAVAATDTALSRIVKAVDDTGGICVITADHGNCELMYDETTGQPHTAHTTNPVPLIVHDDGVRHELDRDGALSDVAPTILDLVGLEKPAEMTGRSLLRSRS